VPRVVTLETDRLVLRPFREDDVDAYLRLVNHPDAMLAHGDTEELTPLGAWRTIAAYLGHWAMRGYGPFAVQEKTTGAFVGRIGPYFPPNWPGLEIMWAVDRAHWGRGFAPEAARAARDFVFRTVGDTEVMSLINPGHTASRRVAEKLGAVPVREVDFEGMRLTVYRHSPSG
jgi:RimJ/RimL family protein N-acetyltransferase